MQVTGVRRGYFPEFSDPPHIDARFPQRHSRPRLNAEDSQKDAEQQWFQGRSNLFKKIREAGSAADIETMIHALLNLVIGQIWRNSMCSNMHFDSNCAPMIGLKTWPLARILLWSNFSMYPVCVHPTSAFIHGAPDIQFIVRKGGLRSNTQAFEDQGCPILLTHRRQVGRGAIDQRVLRETRRNVQRRGPPWPSGNWLLSYGKSPFWMGKKLIIFSMSGKLPSGKRWHNYGKSSCLMSKSTISMAISQFAILT